MGTKALTGLAPEWYTPEDQRGDDVEFPTRYKIKPLDGAQFLEVLDHGTVRGDEFIPNYRGRLTLLRYGVKDWENVTDDAGENYAFNLARVKFIHYEHLLELSTEILQRSAIREDEAKNSESQ